VETVAETGLPGDRRSAYSGRETHERKDLSRRLRHLSLLSGHRISPSRLWGCVDYREAAIVAGRPGGALLGTRRSPRCTRGLTPMHSCGGMPLSSYTSGVNSPGGDYPDSMSPGPSSIAAPAVAGRDRCRSPRPGHAPQVAPCNRGHISGRCWRPIGRTGRRWAPASDTAPEGSIVEEEAKAWILGRWRQRYYRMHDRKDAEMEPRSSVDLRTNPTRHGPSHEVAHLKVGVLPSNRVRYVRVP